jgi:hypothetical protein
VKILLSLAGILLGGTLMANVAGSSTGDATALPMSAVKLVEEKVIGKSLVKDVNSRFIRFEGRERRERWERRERRERGGHGWERRRER